MKIERVKTYEVKIYVGSEIGYSGKTLDVTEAICQDYVNNVGLCVTVTKTKYFYVNGSEDGVIIGLINYPRFPESESAIKNKAIALAKKLKLGLGQLRVSIVCPDETIMIS